MKGQHLPRKFIVTRIISGRPERLHVMANTGPEASGLADEAKYQREKAAGTLHKPSRRRRRRASR